MPSPILADHRKDFEATDTTSSSKQRNSRTIH